MHEPKEREKRHQHALSKLQQRLHFRCGTHQLPASSYPYPSPPPCRTPRVRQGGGGGCGNSALTPIPGQQMTRHRQREPPIPRKRGRGASAGASSPPAPEDLEENGKGTQKQEPPRFREGSPERRRRPTLPHCGAVPSARPGLTSLFGMGRGGTPGLKPPEYDMSGH